MNRIRKLATVLMLFGFPLAPIVGAQSSASVPQIEVGAVDTSAASTASHFWYHIRPAATSAARKLPSTALSNRVAGTVSATPRPEMYPADLSYHGGRLVTTADQHPVYFDCPAGPTACWGNPAAFLNNLDHSVFIHLLDQYVGSNANNRYPLSAAVSVHETLQTNMLDQNDIATLVHTAAAKLGKDAGYTDIYHVFLPRGIDVCLGLGSICYSPDNPGSFSFCAYHGSVDFDDIGHVLFTVEPYQNVPGCQSAQPSPNGLLVDSTASILSHEMFETITDPDGTSWWADKSLIESGEEIGDVCEPLFNANSQFDDPVFTVNGKSYRIQLEYSNNFHGCTH